MSQVRAALVDVLLGRGSGPLRSYANAAVAVRAEGEMYEVRVKDAYADQWEFREAFASEVRARRLAARSARVAGAGGPRHPSVFDPPAAWRPGDRRRITGAWLRSSSSVGLLIVPGPGDPDPGQTG
ncbi:hypothetical protein [Actinomadura fibrosa]|uniref:Uncharacterized protein n=1 Tax=Actinomadura fibrosa TaxID=111802 RepID=A0ABW2XHE8_9ACTN|nr:hypothetical protein [Actinomadura fibrosa]